MYDSRGTSRPSSDFSFDQPHLYDAVDRPSLFDGVVSRRIVAFAVDAIVVFTLSTLLCIGLLIVGLFTFGLAWFLLGVVFPAVALGYNAMTLSRPASATYGMQLMGLEMRTWYGAPMNAALAAFHALAFYFTVSVFTPLVLLVPLFNERKRCLHDFLTGTVLINA